MFTFLEYTDKNGNIVEVYTGLTKHAWNTSSPIVQQAEIRAIAEIEGVEPEELFVVFRGEYK